MAAGPVAAQQEPPAAEGESDGGFVLPPLVMSGVLSFDSRMSRAQQGGTSVGHLLSATLNARSFIYAPWLATVNGTLRMSTSWSRSPGSSIRLGVEQGPEPTTAQSQFLSGSARINLFPRSRFPVDATYERSDSRLDQGLVPGLDYMAQSLSVAHRYRPEDNAFDMGLRYLWREQAGAGFRDTQNTLDGDATTSWKNHSASLGASVSRAQRKASGSSSTYASLIGRHNYTPPSPLSVNTTANLTYTRETGLAAESDVAIGQFATVGVYQVPATQLSLTGSLRGLLVKDALRGGTVDSLSGSVGASYQYTPQLQLTGGGSFSLAHNGGGQARTVNATGTAGWQGETIQLLGFNYTRYGNASVGLGLVSGGPVSQTLGTASLTAGHSAMRQWQPLDGSTLALSGSQSVSVFATQQSPKEADAPPSSSYSLINNVSLTWNVGSENKRAYAQLSYSDAISFGPPRSRFQLANLQVSGTWELGRSRAISGDITMQRSIQHSAQAFVDAFSGAPLQNVTRGASASGQLSYSDGRLFDVRGLRFSSLLRLAQDVLEQPGTLPSLPVRETKSWENRLDWSVGRLDLGLQYRVSWIDHRTLQSLYFRAQRSFGE